MGRFGDDDGGAEATTAEVEEGIGAGPLSHAAIRRLGSRSPDVPIGLPDFADSRAVADWRAATNELWGEEDDPEVPARAVHVGGVRCLDAGAPDGPVVVYAHGGGFCLGSARTAIPITARLARDLRVLSVEYRLAPECPYPAAVDDVTQVCLTLAASGLPYALAGDSAGANIVMCAAIRLRDRSVRGPVALALLSPHLDHGTTRSPGSQVGELAALSSAYLGGMEPTDPRVSPLRASLHGLPPVLIQASDEEPLVPQSVALSRRLRTAGGSCVLDLWRGLWHAWQYHRDLPEADRALAEARRFLRDHLQAL